MLGLGLGINKSIPKKSIFNLPNALHEWNYQNATDIGTTVTEVDTGSIGGLNLANIDAASKPTLGSDSIEYNGTTQRTINNTANFRSGDSTGVLHFKFIPNDNTTNQSNYIWSSADTSVVSLVGVIYRNLKVRFTLALSGAFISVESNGTLNLNVVNTVSIYSDGSSHSIIINGVAQTLTTIAGSPAGEWFDYVTGRDNIVSGGYKGTTDVFSPSKQKYKCYTAYVSAAAALSDHNEIRNTNF